MNDYFSMQNSGYSGQTNRQPELPAIVSIETQKFFNTYDAENGFEKGTVFPALYKPFLAGGI